MALVTTSNIEPRNLYEGGLQRDRFMPAISLIERYCEIFNLDSGTNYRLRTLSIRDSTIRRLMGTLQTLYGIRY